MYKAILACEQVIVHGTGSNNIVVSKVNSTHACSNLDHNTVDNKLLYLCSGEQVLLFLE